MAFGSTSSVFGAFVTDALNASHSLDLDGHTLKVALYGNTITPDKTVSAANTAYGAGQWAAGGEVTDSTGWAAGGRTLASATSGFSGATYTFDGADLASGTIASGITNAYGCQLYDSQSTTVSNHGIAFLSFGGAVSATAGGTLTIVWNASGIFTVGY